MKVTVPLVVTVCYIIGLYCGQSEAVKCYKCSSQISVDCADPFKTSTTENCSMCAKSKVTAADLDDIQVFQRGCATKNLGSSTGCQPVVDDGVSGDVCLCDSDLCNASTRASMTTALLFLLPVLLMCSTKL